MSFCLPRLAFAATAFATLWLMPVNPFAESVPPLCIPPRRTRLPGRRQWPYRFISGSVAASPLCEMGLEVVGVLEHRSPSTSKRTVGPPLVRGLLYWCGSNSLLICATGCGNRDWRTLVVPLPRRDGLH